MSILSELMALGMSEKEAAKAVPIVTQQRAARGVVAPHPSVTRAMENLKTLEKSASPEAYNAALQEHVENIGKTLTGPIPGGKGTGYSVGHNAPIWFTPPGGTQPLRLPRALESEIQPGSTIHNVSREDLIKQLGGYKADPAAVAAQAKEATVAQQAEAQKLIEAARQRDMVQRAKDAIKTENAARNEAALNAELSQANALKQQGNMAQRASAAGVEGDVVDLAALLGEKRSQVPPAVELARQTIPLPNQPAAASAAASASARGPWSPAPPPATSVPTTGPIAKPNQFTLNRPSVEGSVLGAAAAGGAGALAYDQATDGSLRRQLFPDTVNQTELDALPAGGQSYRYDRFGAGPWNNPPEATSVTDQARDILRARLAAPMQDSIHPSEEAPPAASPAPPASIIATPNAALSVSRPTAANTARNVIAERATLAPTSSGADRGTGILSSIFSGKDYQSKGGELRQNSKINWGDPESAADFFRASRANLATPSAAGINPDDSNMNRGGVASNKPNKDATLHKALEIIHHMMVHGKH